MKSWQDMAAWYNSELLTLVCDHMRTDNIEGNNLKFD